MKSLFLFVFTVLFLSFSSVFAQGFYIGAGIGNTYMNSELGLEQVGEQAKEISENSTGYKFFGGFRGESIIGLEGGYRNLGTVDTQVEDIKFESKTTGWDVAAMARLEIAIIDIFGKAGAFFWKTESALGDLGEDVTGTAFMWGVGAGVHLGAFGIRLEWENFQVETPDNLSMLSLSATFGF